MAYIQQENPMPLIDGFVTFEVDDNGWATFGQTVMVSTPNPGSYIIGYFIVYDIIYSPNLLIVCINDSSFSYINYPPTSPIPQGSFIGPGSPGSGSTGSGSSGTQGPQGITGFQGPQGVTGPQGITGFQGPQGVTGPQGPGIEVTNYSDDRVLTSDGTPYGSNAEENLLFDGYILSVIGSATISGTLSISGYSFPNADGSIGQFIYTDGNGILGWTSSNTSSSGSQGPIGQTGTQGSQGNIGFGDTGPQGNVGVQGNTGSTGFQGNTGEFGNTGPQGNVGVQGNTGPQGLTGNQGPSGSGGSTLTSFIPGTITVSPSTRQDDYNPSGLSGATTIFFNNTASISVSGLQGGSDGRIIYISNVSDYLVILENESTDSSASNRFNFPTGMAYFMMPRRSISLTYTTTLNRWVCLESFKQFDYFDDLTTDNTAAASSLAGLFYQHAQNGGSMGFAAPNNMRGPGIMSLSSGNTNAQGNAKISFGSRYPYRLGESNSYFLGLSQIALSSTFSSAISPCRIGVGFMNSGAISSYLVSTGAWWVIDTLSNLTNFRYAVNSSSMQTATLTYSTGFLYTLGVFSRRNTGADFFYSTDQVRYYFEIGLTGPASPGSYVNGLWSLGATAINKTVSTDFMAVNYNFTR